MQASDSDAAANSKISYKIIEQDGEVVGKNASHGSLFVVNPSSGELKLNFSRSNLSNVLGSHSLSISVSASTIFT